MYVVTYVLSDLNAKQNSSVMSNVFKCFELFK